MKKTLFRILTTGSIMVIAVHANAQEFGVELNGGLQGLQYDITGGKAKIQPGGALGFNYTFPLGKRWGLITGLAGGYYNTKTTLDNGSLFSSYAIDEEESAFEFRVKPEGYEEKLSFFTAGIPLMLQYHTTGKTQWYLNGGGKFLFPFNVKSKASASQLAMSGYYPDFNVELDNVPQHGFGVVNNLEKEYEPELKPTATLSAATGLSFPLGSSMRLYTGVYIDYGLTDMRKNRDESAALVNYSPTGINNVQVTGLLPKGGDAKLLAYGLQVKLGFVKKKKDAKPVAEPVVVAAPVEVKEEPKSVQEPTPAPAPAPVEEKKPEPAPAPVITKAETEQVQAPVVFSELNSTAVPEALKPHLDSVANILNKYPDLQVALVGHTCDIGTEKENETVGINRAKAVAAYLRDKGIAESRMELSSARSTQPLVPNTSEHNRRLNRRVTVTVK
jgi:outer membrane protein OmpA-like peptidoglycan-associated protein